MSVEEEVDAAISLSWQACSLLHLDDEDLDAVCSLLHLDAPMLTLVQQEGGSSNRKGEVRSQASAAV